MPPEELKTEQPLHNERERDHTETGRRDRNMQLAPGLPAPAPTLALCGLPKTPGACSLQKGSSYTRPCLQYQERLLFHLIHRNKHGERAKIKIENYVPSEKNQDKTPEKKTKCNGDKQSAR